MNRSETVELLEQGVELKLSIRRLCDLNVWIVEFFGNHQLNKILETEDHVKTDYFAHADDAIEYVFSLGYSNVNVGSSNLATIEAILDSID